MDQLQEEATNPKTSPVRLQKLAKEEPSLRPLIALNPTAYPGLVDWLGGLGDPAVNAALSQRRAMEAKVAAPSAGDTRRVSVFQRSEGEAPNTQSPLEGVRTGNISAPPLPKSKEPDASPAGPAPSAPPIPTGHQAQSLPADYQVHPTVRTDSIPVAEQHSDRWRFVLVVALLAIIAGALVFAVVFLMRPVDKPTAQEETSPVVEQSAQSEDPEPAPSEDETKDEDADEDDEKFPAPPNALQFGHFMAPSGNIACQISEHETTCTIMSHAFHDSTLPTCGMGPLSVTITESEAHLDCAHPPISTSQAATLSYSDVATEAHAACESTVNGISCWNTISGKSFALARQGYIFGETPIPEANLPWVQ